MVLHYKFKPYQCQFCKKEFTMSRVATAHKCTKGNYKCLKCDKECVSYDQLRNHTTNVHSGKVKQNFVCDKCPFETKYKQSLLKHFNMHLNFESKRKTKHRIYKCNLCPALFRSLKAIPIHRKKYHGKRIKFI